MAKTTYFIQNRSPHFTILYLPNRTLRMLGKAVEEVTEQELNSKQFQRRKDDFNVRIMGVDLAKDTPEVQETIQETPKRKRGKKEQLDIEEPVILDEPIDSEPDEELGSL